MSHQPLQAITFPLAPLQRTMLSDSLENPATTHHVEQVKIEFSRDFNAAVIASAWQETVAATAALQIGFRVENEIAIGMEPVATPGALSLEMEEPTSFAEWLELDRRRSLLNPGVVPWRAVYWPRSHRWVWTFHHALLDGRSIARILQGFLARLAGTPAIPLTFTHWQSPTAAEIAAAGHFFQSKSVNPSNTLIANFSHGSASRCLGAKMLGKLERRAAKENVTAATAITWAWGQAMATATNAAAVLIEQVRAGLPPPNSAGFTMHTLPLFVSRCENDPAGNWDSIRALRTNILTMRDFEAVSAADFPSGIFPDLRHPAVSVIMVERGTLAWQIGAGEPSNPATSVTLHESSEQSQLACAFMRPDFALQVEGSTANALLEIWSAKIEALLMDP